MTDIIDAQVQIIIDKIKHYLITFIGRTLDEATDEEFYLALCWALREEIMINWAATNHTFRNKKVRKIHYLSMEYMPGRLLGNNLTNICNQELVQKLLKTLGKDYRTILRIEPEIGIGNGGLGRLASCFMDSLATKKYPAMGYGMRYQYGIFEQELWFGVQVERPDCWLLSNNPWTFRRDSNAVSIHFWGEMIEETNGNGEIVHNIKNYDEVRALPYDLPIVGYSSKHSFPVITLRLWSTKESPRNFQLQKYNAGQLDEAAENTSLTDVLYPNDNNEMGKRVRLKQEFLLVSASVQDIVKQHLELYGNLDEFADKVRIQINDTHPALIFAELPRLLMKAHQYSFDDAIEITKTVCSYTNHTVLVEALEEWNQHRVSNLLPRQYRIIEQIDHKLRTEIHSKYKKNSQQEKKLGIIQDGQIRMANLAIYSSHCVNGVARLHTEILKEDMFSDFYQFCPEKFINVTNGVTQRRWLLHANPKLAEFLTKRIGDGWITNFEEIKKIADFATDKETQQEFIEIKKHNKQKLIDLLKQQTVQRHCLECELQKEAFLNENALFDVHIKRIHEYKRQLMNALHILMVYLECKENPSIQRIPRLWVFGGKAAPGYELAKNIIRLIYCISRKICNDPEMKGKMSIAYVENYNVSKAEIIIPAADLSEQISTAGMEASGTGNMKLAINGALTIGTDDGANVEMREHITDNWWPFLFGGSAKENYKLWNLKTYNPYDILHSNPLIKKTVESLVDHSLVENDAEHKALEMIYKTLLEKSYREADHYFVLKDLQPYYEMQKRVEELYKDTTKWVEFAIHNMAGMGSFSTDISIKNYADKIWNIEPCELDMHELERVRKEFTEHDKCRIVGA